MLGGIDFGAEARRVVMEYWSGYNQHVLDGIVSFHIGLLMRKGTVVSPQEVENTKAILEEFHEGIEQVNVVTLELGQIVNVFIHCVKTGTLLYYIDLTEPKLLREASEDFLDKFYSRAVESESFTSHPLVRECIADVVVNLMHHIIDNGNWSQDLEEVLFFLLITGYILGARLSNELR